LPGGRAKHLGAETGHIESGATGSHHFNGTTGYTKCQGPQGVGPADIDKFVR
jgi:hypothetical protein